MASAMLSLLAINILYSSWQVIYSPLSGQRQACFLLFIFRVKEKQKIPSEIASAALSHSSTNQVTLFRTEEERQTEKNMKIRKTRKMMLPVKIQNLLPEKSANLAPMVF